MAQDYIFNGQTFTLDDGLSEDQARGIIQNYLKTQEDNNQINPTQTFSTVPEEKTTDDSLQAAQLLTQAEKGEAVEKKRKEEIGFFDEGSVIKETGEGIVSGLIAIPQGILELGASVVEKHFTDDNDRPGPDHPFSMTPETWKEMVDNTRILERSLGHFTKEVQDNEKETIVLQRRAIRFIRDMNNGGVITRDDFQFQRPCPEDAFNINNFESIIGKTLNRDIVNGDYLKEDDIL